MPLLKLAPDLEHKIGQQFFFERTIRRAFSTAHERELWLERERDEEYRNYIFPILADETPTYIHEEFGTGVVKCPGYIDAKTFLDANHTYLRRKGILRMEEFDFYQLDVDQSSYNGERFDAIVFSEGYRGRLNPFFQYLPLETTKGEVLTLNIQGLDTKEIVNRKCFILPTHNGVYKLGATFTWKTTDISLTEEAKKELLGQYSDLITFVRDRPGHDRRYAVDARRITKELSWMPKVHFSEGLEKTVKWYLNNQCWWHEAAHHAKLRKGLRK